jgi:hypothetical protein
VYMDLRCKAVQLFLSQGHWYLLILSVQTEDRLIAFRIAWNIFILHV